METLQLVKLINYCCFFCQLVQKVTLQDYFYFTLFYVVKTQQGELESILIRGITVILLQ